MELALGCLVFSSIFLLLGSREKNATSDPDIKAETISNTNKTKNDTAIPKVKGWKTSIASINNLSGGSQSVSISGKID